MLCGLLVGCASRQDTGPAPMEAPSASAGDAQVSGEAPSSDAQAPVEAPPAEAKPVESASEEAPPTKDDTSPGALLPLVVTKSPEQKDSIGIYSMRVEGPVLTLGVSHGGGCAEHTYSLEWDGMLQQGVDGTPVANLVLVHDAHGDRCKAMLRARPRFDLSSVSKRFGAQFGKASGAVNLVIQDQAPVRYVF
ncbi:putative lipoprotein [Myxococcus hansupus]|uniref:Putative lipoprotein n=1 Tax=Pseudomyxococcus hansupus TaxID=1297742 RepID=A0A0H4WSY8_9BACT|nr:putative lipoprotein [Myxococcus hansupus]